MIQNSLDGNGLYSKFTRLPSESRIELRPIRAHARAAWPLQYGNRSKPQVASGRAGVAKSLARRREGQPSSGMMESSSYSRTSLKTSMTSIILDMQTAFFGRCSIIALTLQALILRRSKPMLPLTSVSPSWSRIGCRTVISC